MKINFKRTGMATWFYSVALVAMVAGCGGGTSRQQPIATATPTTTTTPTTTPTTGPTASTGEIVFVSNSSGSRRLFRVNLDGSNLTLIPTNAVRDISRPSWFPNGQELVYTDSRTIRDSSGGSTISSIRRVNRDGSNDREIVSNAGGAVVSPDGHRIVYGSVIANADGSNPMRLTADGSNGRDFSWSPDGQRLIFTEYSFSESRLDLFVIDVDGSNRRRLTNSLESELSPRWSPDGRRIVYYAVARSTGASNNVIFVIDVDGSNLTRLTSLMDSNHSPAWTSDGQSIVYNSGSLFIMNADGSNQRPISSTPIVAFGGFDVR